MWCILCMALRSLHDASQALRHSLLLPHLYSDVLWVSFSRLMSLKARNSFGLRAPAAGLAASAWVGMWDREWAGGITCGRSEERYK